MNDHKKGQSTGPKTQAGKLASSQNARKDSIFVKGYLPWEDQEAKRQEFDALVKQWHAKDPTRLIIIRTIEQSALTLDRLMHAQAKKIEGLMQSLCIAKQFCERAGLSVLLAAQLPAWFFVEDGEQEKQLALQLAKIYDEANDLKMSYSDQLVSRVKEEYPLLYQFVLSGYREGSSFISVLGHRYKQSVPTMNLTVLMNELTQKYPHHFRWAEDSVRYQIIIDGLRAEQIEEALDLDKTNRYATNIQNRIAKGVATLAAIDQHEYLRATQETFSRPVTPAVLLNEEKQCRKPESSE